MVKSNMMKKIFLFLHFTFFFALAAIADVQVTARAPQQVVMGDKFQLQYVVTDGSLSDIQLGAIQGFQVLAGPYTSTQSSFQMINGRTTRNSSVTLTYVLMPTAEGRGSIAPATIQVEGKTIKSKALTIEVLPADQTPNRAQQSAGTTAQGGSQQQGAAQQSTTTSSTSADGRDLFITVSASKKRVYEQEAVLLTYKVYTLVNLVQLQGNMPELNGCHQQEIDLPGQKSLKLEHYNGRNYKTCVWSQYVIFPQQSGKISIPAIPFEGIVQQVTRSRDPFEAFFGGGMVQEVKRTVTAPAIEIQVDALPQPKPADFSGAVGEFTLSSSLTPDHLKSNEALTLRLVVSGTGNMKLIKAPKVNFPKDFESYDPKITDKTKTGASGTSGNKVFDYVCVPRHGGNYDIPEVEFTYFDPKAKEYKTLKAGPYSVAVEKGAGSPSQNYSPVQQEELEMLAQDIRFIKRGATSPMGQDTGFFGSTAMWLSYGLSLLLFVALTLIFRRQIAANADVARRRTKGAGKAANKRLKVAAKMMKAGKAGEFYDEVQKALWGFVADKLNMSAEALNKENVAQQLQDKGIDQQLIDDFLSALSDCEFARYAPGDPGTNMQNIYDQAANVINKIK